MKKEHLEWIRNFNQDEYEKAQKSLSEYQNGNIRVALKLYCELVYSKKLMFYSEYQKNQKTCLDLSISDFELYDYIHWLNNIMMGRLKALEDLDIYQEFMKKWEYEEKNEKN